MTDTPEQRLAAIMVGLCEQRWGYSVTQAEADSWMRAAGQYELQTRGMNLHEFVRLHEVGTRMGRQTSYIVHPLGQDHTAQRWVPEGVTV